MDLGTARHADIFIQNRRNHVGTHVQHTISDFAVIYPNYQTSDYTLTMADADGRAIEMDSDSPVNLTVPLNADVPIPIGTMVEVTQLGDGSVYVVAADPSIILRSPFDYVKIATRNGSITLRKRGNDDWCIEGNLGFDSG